MPLPPPPPQYMPPPQPAAPPGPPPTEYAPLFKPNTAPYPMLVKNTFLVLTVFISVLMLFLGAILVHSAPLVTNKDYSGSSSAAIDADRRAQVTMTDTGHILADVGAFLLLFMLLLAGLLRTDWSDYVRFGVLFFVAVFAFSLGFKL